MIKLQYPVDFIGITTYYSEEHPAIDLGWHDKENEPIYACADGVVSRIFEDEQFGGGLTLEIKYADGFKTQFKHLSIVLVDINDKVKQYQQVAVMGKSGWACKGTHLHLNLYKDDVRVNPTDYLYVYLNQKVSDSDKSIVKYYTPTKYNIGDKVIIEGDLFYTPSTELPTGTIGRTETEITRISAGSPHPYNTTGDLGWMNECDIKPYEEPEKDYKELYEQELTLNKKLLKENCDLLEINKDLKNRIFNAVDILSK